MISFSLKKYFILFSFFNIFNIFSFLYASETAPPNGLRPIMEYDPRYPFWLIFLIVFVALSLICLGVFLWNKFRKKKSETPINLLVELEKEIRNLSPIGVFEKKQQIEYFWKLSFLFRQYLELILKSDFTSLTVKEIRTEIKKHFSVIHDDEIKEILEFLESSEMVKYSINTTTQELALKHKEKVISWVVDLGERVRQLEIEKQKRNQLLNQ